MALEEVYRKCYGGKKLNITRFGKPTEATYRHAERLLAHESRLLGITDNDLAPHESHDHKKAFPIKTVYAIGDNIESDIKVRRWLRAVM